MCRKMQYWMSFLYLLVCISADDIASEQCEALKCTGLEYECIDGRCYCAPGYIPNHFQVRCVKCPGLGEKCSGQCCNIKGNDSLHCWHGICQPCYDAYDKWICRDNIKDILLISTAQIVVGAVLVFGILAAFAVVYKLCDSNRLSLDREGSLSPGRLSIGSLQLIVDQRLRDAPPRYTRQPASGSAIYPAISYINNGFVHDSSIPPPPYTPPDGKTEESTNTIMPILHI